MHSFVYKLLFSYEKDVKIDKPSYDFLVTNPSCIMTIFIDLSKDFRNFQDVMTHFKTTEQQRHIYKLPENTLLDPG